MSETSLTPSLPFLCVHQAVKRVHDHPGYYRHWWECEHCGVAMHLSHRRGGGEYVADDPPRYHACTVCTK